jgi:hypothetical protein
MSNKKILIFQTGEPTHFENSTPMRLISLSEIMVSNGYDVTVITTKFDHFKKDNRNVETGVVYKKNKIKYIFLDSINYYKNISILRLLNHLSLSYNLTKLLKRFDYFDHVFIGFPPIEPAFILSRWCKVNKIPYTLDIKDDWPHLIKIKINKHNSPLVLLYIKFLEYLKNYSIKNSKFITTISDDFLKNLKKNKKLKEKISTLYLTKKKIFEGKPDDYIKKIFNGPKKKIIFIGNLNSDIYNFQILQKLKNYISSNTLFEFHFFGEGEKKNELFKNLSFDNIFIHKSINFNNMCYALAKADAFFYPCLNRFDFQKSLPNKIIDCIQYNLPIITSLNGTLSNLIRKYSIGYNYKNFNDLKNILKDIVNNKNNFLLKNFKLLKREKIVSHFENYKNYLNKIDYKEKNTIFIFQSGEILSSDRLNADKMRAENLIDTLIKNNFNVTLITSNFDHFSKSWRFKTNEKFIIKEINKNYKIVFLNSPGYTKNISLKRIFDHYILACNLTSFLIYSNTKPSFGFIGYPPIETSLVFAAYLRKKNIPFCIDVKDLWPDIFKDLVGNNFFYTLIINVYIKFINIFIKKIFIAASFISSNCSFFLNYNLKKISRKKNIYDVVVYLTKPLHNKINYNFLKKINFNKNKFNIVYSGNLNNTFYEFKQILASLNILRDNNLKNFHLYISGYGSKDNIYLLKRDIKKNKLNKHVTYINFLDKMKMFTLFKKSSVSILPFKNNINYAQNLPNKLVYCYQVGIPVIISGFNKNSSYILKKKIGLNYMHNDSKSLSKSLIRLISNKSFYKKIKINSINHSKSINFNHDRNYLKFFKSIKNNLIN